MLTAIIDISCAVLVFFFVVIVFDASSWGKRLHAHAAAIRERMAGTHPSEFTKYPHRLKTYLLSVGGETTKVTVEVTPEVVYVYTRRRMEEKGLVARIPLEEIAAVLFMDTTWNQKSGPYGSRGVERQAHPSAGFSIVVTGKGRYEFFSEGILAPYRLLKTAKVIRDAYSKLTGNSLPLIDPNKTYLKQVGR